MNAERIIENVKNACVLLNDEEQGIYYSSLEPWQKNFGFDKNGKEENKNAPSSGKDGQEQKDGQEDDPSSEP